MPANNPTASTGTTDNTPDVTPPPTPPSPARPTVCERRSTREVSEAMRQRERQMELEALTADKSLKQRRIRVLEAALSAAKATTEMILMSLLRERITVMQVRNMLRAHQAHHDDVQSARGARDARDDVLRRGIGDLVVEFLRAEIDVAQVRNVFLAQQVRFARLVRMQVQVSPVLRVAESEDDEREAPDQNDIVHDEPLEKGALGDEVPDGLMPVEGAGWVGLLAIGGWLCTFSPL